MNPSSPKCRCGVALLELSAVWWYEWTAGGFPHGGRFNIRIIPKGQLWPGPELYCSKRCVISNVIDRLTDAVVDAELAEKSPSQKV